jgi:arylsulfatase A-like enzyme
MTQHSRSAASSLINAAAWFGLVAGLLEAAGTLAIIRWDRLGWLLCAGPQAAWIFPLTNLLLFLGVAVCLWIGLLAVPKAAALRYALAVPAFLCFFDVASFSARIKPLGSFVLALGLTVQFWHWLRRKQGPFVSFCRRTIPWLLAFVVALGVGEAAWGRITETRQISRAVSPAPGSPNVLLIVIDTGRADHFSFLGYPRKTTPEIDRLAREGTVWERAFATSSWTLPSHASIFTGRYFREHGADRQPLDDRYTTLAEALAARGYLTAGFSANIYNVTRPVGLARGFQHWEDFYGNVGDMAARTYYVRRFGHSIRSRLGKRDILGRKRATEVNREFLQWLDRRRDRPFFAFLNYFDAHDPYFPPEPYRRRFSNGLEVGGLVNSYFLVIAPNLTADRLQSEIDAYDASLLYVDHEIGRLVQELDQRGLGHNTLLVITSDHGESFGEHNLLLHGNSLYYETLRVPLILRMPGRIPADRRLTDVVSLRAIPATVMKLIDTTGSSPFPGPGLIDAGSASPDTQDSSVLAELEEKEFEAKSRPAQHGWLKSVLTERWQFILNQSGKMELYDLAEDPKQLRNQANSVEHSALVQSLRAKLDSLPRAASLEDRTRKEAHNPE